MTSPALIQNWPKKWTEDPELAPVIRYLDRFLLELKDAVDANTVAIEDIQFAQLDSD